MVGRHALSVCLGRPTCKITNGLVGLANPNGIGNSCLGSKWCYGGFGKGVVSCFVVSCGELLVTGGGGCGPQLTVVGGTFLGGLVWVGCLELVVCCLAGLCIVSWHLRCDSLLPLSVAWRELRPSCWPSELLLCCVVGWP